MNTVENLRAWFLTCPDLSVLSEFNADYIGTKATDCTIYSLPSNLTYTEDVLGDIIFDKRQIRNFILGLRLPFGNDPRQNLKNLQLFDSVMNWMYHQNDIHNFPQIAEGDVVSIMPIKTQSMTTADASTALYELRFAMTYERSDV